MSNGPTPLAPSLRGSALFSSEALQRVFNQTVLPEIDEGHSVVVVGTVTAAGLQAAVTFARPVTVLGLSGEWRAEAAVLCDWSGQHEAEARVLFKI